MINGQVLLLPGPTPIPPQVLRAMTAPAINHRGPEFKELLAEVRQGLQWLLATTSEVEILTCSGSGAMEAAVANLLSPGDKALVVTVGAFGERFAQICRAFEVDAEVMAFPYGQPADPSRLADRLKADKGRHIKAVLLQHNETSTGVLNDVKALSLARGDHPALLVVDAISGLGAAELLTDAWGVDVVVAGSQKALMLPPGLAMVSANDRAWAAIRSCHNRRYYLDLRAARDTAAKGQTPYTPAVSLLFGLRESLRLLAKETLSGCQARHALLRDMTRLGVKALGLDPLAADAVASPSVTAVKAPSGLKSGAIIRDMRERYGVIVAGGQGEVKDAVFRFGHLGYCFPSDVIAGLMALEGSLDHLGYRPAIGVARAAAESVLEARAGVVTLRQKGYYGTREAAQPQGAAS